MKDNLKLLKLEMMIEKILFLLENRKIYKEVPLTNNRHETK